MTEVIARHILPGRISVGAIYWSSLRVGKWVARGRAAAAGPPPTGLTPAELAVGKTAAPSRANDDPVQPGNSNNNPILSPSQLGYSGGFSGLFGLNGRPFTLGNTIYMKGYDPATDRCVVSVHAMG